VDTEQCCLDEAWLFFCIFEVLFPLLIGILIIENQFIRFVSWTLTNQFTTQ